METRLHAEQIYDYMIFWLKDRKEITEKDKEEMIQEIVYMIDNS